MKTIYGWIMTHIISPCEWGTLKQRITGRKFKGNLTVVDHNRIWSVLSQGNYIIATRRKTHLTTYLINIAHWLLAWRAFIKTGFKTPFPKFGYWSHILLNIEGTTTPIKDDDFMLVEAVGKGVKVSSFLEVFDCDAVKIMAPVSAITGEIRPWEIITDRVFEDVGKPYDLNFNLKNKDAMSCVEFIYDTLKNDSLYCYDFEALTKLIELYGNLEPEMFGQAKCFKTILEIRR